MELGLQCTKFYRFVQYTPRKSYNRFFQPWLMRARREGDENPLSEIVAETMKFWLIPLKDIRSWIDPSIQPQKYLNDEKTHKAMKHCLKE